MKACPECCSEVEEEAAVCSACGRRIVGKTCPECAEISKEEAKRCRYCNHDFARQERLAIIEPYRARAALLPTFLFRGRFIPQEIHLSPEKLVIKTWGFFWLSHVEEEIPWEKIAGYHYHSGLFWDQIEIQTRGQKANKIGCLGKMNGKSIKERLERMKE